MNHFNSKILVLDTDPAFLRIADERLSARGFKVYLSSNYKETIETLKQTEINSLLVNIDKACEREALLNCIESIEARPVVFYSNSPLKQYPFRQEEKYF